MVVHAVRTYVRYFVYLRTPCCWVVQGVVLVALAFVLRSVIAKSLAPPRRRWKHLSYRAMGKRQGWVVQFQGRTIGGLHPTEATAARTLMKELGGEVHVRLTPLEGQE